MAVPAYRGEEGANLRAVGEELGIPEQTSGGTTGVLFGTADRLFGGQDVHLQAVHWGNDGVFNSELEEEVRNPEHFASAPPHLANSLKPLGIE